MVFDRPVFEMPSCGTPQSGPMRGNSTNSSAITGAPSSAVRAASPPAWRRLGWPTGMWARTSGGEQAPHRDQHRHRDRQRLRVEEVGEDDEEAEEEDDECVAARAQLERLQRHQRDRERDAGLLAEQRSVRSTRSGRSATTSTATSTQRPGSARVGEREAAAPDAGRAPSARSPTPAGARHAAAPSRRSRRAGTGCRALRAAGAASRASSAPRGGPRRPPRR